MEEETTSTKCTFDPSEISGIGMFHCPDCGEMVLAGVPHPDYSIFDIRKELEEVLNEPTIIT